MTNVVTLIPFVNWGLGGQRADDIKTLQTKFHWPEEKVRQLLQAISKTATVVRTQPHLHLLADEPDNRILECAALAKADVIVTGDRHLLALQRHEETRIVTLAGFLRLLKRNWPPGVSRSPHGIAKGQVQD